MKSNVYYVVAQEWRDEQGRGRKIRQGTYDKPEDAYIQCLEHAIAYENEFREKYPGDTVTRAGAGLGQAVARLGKPDVFFQHLHVVSIECPDIENYKKDKEPDNNDHQAS